MEVNIPLVWINDCFKLTYQGTVLLDCGAQKIILGSQIGLANTPLYLQLVLQLSNPREKPLALGCHCIESFDLCLPFEFFTVSVHGATN